MIAKQHTRATQSGSIDWCHLLQLANCDIELYGEVQFRWAPGELQTAAGPGEPSDVTFANAVCTKGEITIYSSEGPEAEELYWGMFKPDSDESKKLGAWFLEQAAIDTPAWDALIEEVDKHVMGHSYTVSNVAKAILDATKAFCLAQSREEDVYRQVMPTVQLTDDERGELQKKQARPLTKEKDEPTL